MSEGMDKVIESREIIGGKSLTVTEIFALLFQYNLLACFQRNSVPVNDWTSSFLDAWGVS